MLTSTESPIRVDFVSPAAHGQRGRLGLTIAPGKCDGRWKRDLAVDLRRLREHYHTDVLVSLLEPDEYQALRIADLADAAESAGVSVLFLPIPDVSVPASMDACRSTVAQMLTALAADKTVVVHCRGGLGRSGLLAACCLTACGVEPDSAIRYVREARPGAVETTEQERFVARFAKVWHKRRDEPDAQDAGKSARSHRLRGRQPFTK